MESENKVPVIINLNPDAQAVNVMLDRVGSIVIQAMEARNRGAIQEAQISTTHELEIAKINKEVRIKESETNTQTTITIAKWDYMYRIGVLFLCFALIIVVYVIGGSALTSTLLPVVTFILGNALKDKISDIFKISTHKKGDKDKEEEMNE